MFWNFSTAFHRKIPRSCDEQPLPRIQKAHSGTVPRVSSTQPTENTPTRHLLSPPNSLFRKILTITPFVLRFCTGAPISTSPNSKKTSILSGRYQKKCKVYIPRIPAPERPLVCTTQKPCFPSPRITVAPLPLSCGDVNSRNTVFRPHLPDALRGSSPYMKACGDALRGASQQTHIAADSGEVESE